MHSARCRTCCSYIQGAPGQVRGALGRACAGPHRWRRAADAALPLRQWRVAGSGDLGCLCVSVSVCLCLQGGGVEVEIWMHCSNGGRFRHSGGHYCRRPVRARTALGDGLVQCCLAPLIATCGWGVWDLAMWVRSVSLVVVVVVVAISVIAPSCRVNKVSGLPQRSCVRLSSPLTVFVCSSTNAIVEAVGVPVLEVDQWHVVVGLGWVRMPKSSLCCHHGLGMLAHVQGCT